MPCHPWSLQGQTFPRGWRSSENSDDPLIFASVFGSGLLGSWAAPSCPLGRWVEVGRVEEVQGWCYYAVRVLGEESFSVSPYSMLSC